MKPEFSEHSLLRLKERGVTKQEVQDALKHGKQTQNGNTIHVTHKTVKGALVVICDIIVKKQKTKVLVITTYWQQ